MSLSRPTVAVPRPATLWSVGAVVLAETLLVVGYFGATDARPTDLRYVVYPFVWINLGLLAVVTTSPRRTTRRVRLVAAAVAVGYFLVLAWLGGLIALSVGPSAHSHANLGGWEFALSAPGWGPRIGYVTDLGHVYFVPYRALGYCSLAYLVYARTLDASAAALSGAVGLGACLSCSFPVLFSLSAGALGPASGVATAAVGLSLDLSTLAFVAALALLARSPDVPRGTD